MNNRFNVNLPHLFWIYYAITRILILFTPGDLYDNESFIIPILEILSGKNPYYTLGTEVIVYPPLFYLTLTAFCIVFGTNTFAFGTCFIVCDLGITITLYKIAGFFFGDKKKQYVPLFFYAFFPLTLLVLTKTIVAPIATFFFIVAIYFYLKKKPFVTGLFAALGFQVEVFPVLLAYVVCVLYLAKKRYKDLFKLIMAFAIVFLTINLPVFQFDVVKMLELIAVHFGRSGTVSIPWSLNNMITGNQLDVNIFAFQILPNLSIDLFTLVTLAGIILFGIWILRYVKRIKEISPKDEIKIIFLFFIFFPIITLNIYFRNFFWIMPLFSLLIAYPNKDTFPPPNLKKYLNYICVGISISLVYFNLIITGGLFFDLHVPRENVFHTVPNFLLIYLVSVFTLFGIFLLLWQRSWLPWIKSMRVNQVSSTTLILETILIACLLSSFQNIAHYTGCSQIIVISKSLVKIALGLAGLYFLIIAFHSYFTANFSRNALRLKADIFN